MSLPDDRFARRSLTVIGQLVVVVLLLLMVWFSVRVWLVVFAGILFAIFLRTLADWVRARTRLPPAACLAMVIVVLIGLGTVIGWLMAPPLSEQINELTQQLPQAIKDLQQRFEKSGLSRFLPRALPPASDVLANAGKAASKIADIFSITLEAVTGAILILFLGIYFAAAPQTYIDGFVRLFPVAKRDRVRHVLAEVGSILRYWLVGQIISMILVGVLIGVGLQLLGVPLPLALGLLAGLLEFIPIFGPWIAATPAVLLAFLSGPFEALYVVLLFIGVNFVESHLLIPVIHRFAVSVPPALMAIALVLMSVLFGFLGLFLATPLTAALLVLVRTVYVEDVLGDRPA